MYEPLKGVSFRQAVKDLKQKLYNEGGDNMVMLFNDITIHVSADSNVDDIATIYDLKHELRSVTTKLDLSNYHH